jgi:hypothetical protein
MASLDKRITVLEAVTDPVTAPRITVTFVSPTRGTVSARLSYGRTVERLDDETEGQFLARVSRLEATHDQS